MTTPSTIDTLSADDATATVGTARRIAGHHIDEGAVSGARVALDWSTSTAKRITIAEPCALTFENVTAGWFYVLEIENGHEGTPEIEWPASTIWATHDRRSPRLSTKGTRDIFGFYYDGAHYIGCEYARGIPAAASRRTGGA